MKNLMISLAIGAAAGVLDIIPMVIRKLDIQFILSAFFMWITVGLLSLKTDFTGLFWVDGMLTAVLIYIPLVFLIFRMDRQALPQITVTTLALGALVGGVRGFLIG